MAFIELVDFDENMLKTPKAEKKTRRSRKSSAPKAEAVAEEAPKAEEAKAEEAPAVEEAKVEEAPAAEEAKAE
jgi:large subunit ribosomal protein L17